MIRASSNPCTRCGKERITFKSWTEKIDTFFGKSEIKYTETVCPDSLCQKIVEQKLAELRERTQKALREKEARNPKNRPKPN